MSVDLSSPVCPVAAQERRLAPDQDSGTSKVRWNVATPVVRHEPVVDDMAGNAGHGSAARGFVAAEGPTGEAPLPVEVEAVGRRRKLTQSACDVARVDRDLAGRHASRCRSRSSPSAVLPRAEAARAEDPEHLPDRVRGTVTAPASPATRTGTTGDAGSRPGAPTRADQSSAANRPRP